MHSDKPLKVLILYSNPGDTDRLRLDLEHRAIDEVIRRLGTEPSTIHRMHAVSVADFPILVSEGEYEIIQFSGHGSPSGIFLERSNFEAGELVGAARLSAALRSAMASPRVLLFLSCFSASSIGTLVNVAPYIVTVDGAADDNACISFIGAFYEAYFKTRSVEHAFRRACTRVEFLGLANHLNPVLTRRALHNSPTESLHAAVIGSNDSVLVDLSQVADQLRAAGMYNEAFLSFLSRKLRVHGWIFHQPRERTLLSIGPYFGEFSWESADDPIRCLRVLRVRDSADEESCAAWASLLIGYNDLAANRYRGAPSPVSPEYERAIQLAISQHGVIASDYFDNGARAQALRKVAPPEFKIAKALVQANLTNAEAAYHRSDLAMTIAHLEASLTSIHDFVDALSDRITEPITH